MTTTRLNNEHRGQTVNILQGILSNIVQFVEFPIQDRQKIIDLWNDKFPRELIDAARTWAKYGYSNSAEAHSVRFVIEHEGKLICTFVKTDELPLTGTEFTPVLRQTEFFSKDPSMRQTVRWVNDAKTFVRVQAMPLQLQYIEDHLGAEDTRAFIEWAVHTAQLRDEITEAVHVIDDVFEMAKTAGQIKRMVPELLQYLPFKLRSAYEEQKRASSMPFDWAPYDKSKVERMITTVSKGHLLSNMAKPTQSGFHVSNISSITWATYATSET